MCIFVGGTGSGKTYAAMRFACDLDEQFNVDRIVFSASDFLDLIKSDLPRGSVIIWDETGIGINSRTFYEQNNLAISYVTQSFRFKNYIVIYTTPSFSYIDKQVRQMFHARVKMEGYDMNANLSYGQWAWLDYNSDTGKIYYKFPRMHVDGRKVIVDNVYFKKPPVKLAHAYEEKRKETMALMYEKYKGQIEAQESGKRIKGYDFGQIVENVKTKYEDFLDSENLIITGDIMQEYGVGRNIAYEAARVLNNWVKRGAKMEKDGI